MIQIMKSYTINTSFARGDKFHVLVIRAIISNTEQVTRYSLREDMQDDTLFGKQMTMITDTHTRTDKDVFSTIKSFDYYVLVLLQMVMYKGLCQDAKTVFYEKT